MYNFYSKKPDKINLFIKIVKKNVVYNIQSQEYDFFLKNE